MEATPISSPRPPLIAVVIPSYRVRDKLLLVLEAIGPEVGWIFVVDDGCPEGSGAYVRQHCQDPRVQVLQHERNLGVGGATVTGYLAALKTSARVVVKLDGDGQMDPALIPRLVHPVLNGRADYTKGNRFYAIAGVASMPVARLLGNAALSFLSKLSTGYWQLFDPTNGFTAIHSAVLRLLPLDALARGYFFESDLLYHLNQSRAVVADVPMRAVYADERSSLKPARVALPFLFGHLGNLFKRLVYSYFLRAFSVASVELVMGSLLILFGVVFGLQAWRDSILSTIPATAGTVMLAGLPVIIGMQLLLSWLNFDVASEPRLPIWPLMEDDGPPPRPGSE